MTRWIAGVRPAGVGSVEGKWLKWECTPELHHDFNWIYYIESTLEMGFWMLFWFKKQNPLPYSLATNLEYIPIILLKYFIKFVDFANCFAECGPPAVAGLRVAGLGQRWFKQLW